MGWGRSTLIVLLIAVGVTVVADGRVAACSCESYSDAGRRELEALVARTRAVVVGVVLAPEVEGGPHRLEVTGNVKRAIGGTIDISRERGECSDDEGFEPYVGGEYVVFGRGTRTFVVPDCSPILAVGTYERIVAESLVRPDGEPSTPDSEASSSAAATTSAASEVPAVDAEQEVGVIDRTESGRRGPLVAIIGAAALAALATAWWITRRAAARHAGRSTTSV